MLSISRGWVAEARTLAAISTSVTLTIFAQLAISTVETLIVARLGVAVLAGVAIALGAYLLVFLFALGVVTAVTPIAAQARGRGDRDGLRRTGQQGLWAALTFSLPGVALLLACAHFLPLVLEAGPQAEAARDYLLGAAWGLPAWVCYVAARSLAIATGRVRITTVIMAASVPVHAGLAWWLVFGGLGLPALGALGAGIAYAATPCAAWLLLALLLRRSPPDDFARAFRRPFTWDGPRYREILALGLPFACRILLREGVLPAAAFAIAPFGASAVAAHAVAARVVDLAGIFSFGFGDAANMRVGHALGAGAPRRAARAARIAIQLSILVNLATAAAIAAWPEWIARQVLGDADPAGLLAAAALLPLAAGLQFLEGIQSAAGGALSGMRDARGPLLIAIAGSWAVGLPLGVLLAWTVHSPPLGLWAGLAAGSGLTTLLYLARLRGKMARAGA